MADDPLADALNEAEWWEPGRVLKPSRAIEFPETTAWRAAQVAAGATVLTSDEWEAIVGHPYSNPRVEDLTRRAAVPLGSDLGVIVVPVEMIARLRQLAVIAGDPDAEDGTVVGMLIRTADATVDMSHAWAGRFVVHPWGEPHSPGGSLHVDDCEMCWASDGDARCTRCGRSTGGPDVCECGELRKIGPCVHLQHYRPMTLVQ